jgi:hypothetical protein
MNHFFHLDRKRRNGYLLIIIGIAAVFGLRISVAQQRNSEADPVPLQTSINAVMVNLVDHAAHFIWDASYAASLSGRDWQQVQQHAIQIVASGTVISIPGTGVADAGWTMSPAWSEWSQKMTDAGLAALEAVEDTDQSALEKAGGDLVDACEGCHAVFKPEVPTEGILHIPHYDE